MNKFLRNLVVIIHLVVFTYGFSQIPTQGDTVLTQVNKKLLLAVHITLDSLGNPSGDTAAIRAGIRGVSQYFERIGLSFDVGEFYFIPNFQYDSMSSGVEMGEAGSIYYVPNRVNITAVRAWGGELEGLCGVGGGGAATVIASCTGGTGFAHELGHAFGLQHTFSGNSHFYGQEDGHDHGEVSSELVKRTNCYTEGDGFCDTPADPFSPLSTETFIEDCAFVYKQKDANGDYYNPDLFNIMSYYMPDCGCEPHFSNEQLEAVAKTVLSSQWW